MSKKALKLGAASILALGAGAAVVSKKNKRNEQRKVTKDIQKRAHEEFRNTERGKYTKNSKGIYYSNGNYEAFARPEKPEGVDDKSAYIVGSGLGALAAACFLVRDGQMKGENIHILEAMDIAGGACDGINDPTRGYVMRGGREMENHFECLWDLFRSIPSIETPGVSVLDEYYWLNKHDPNYSLCRATVNRGEDAHTDGKFNLSQKGCMEIMKLFFTKDEDLYDKTIEDFFDEEVFDSDFWLYWRTMFAFENWHSALEMKLYIQRFIHHIGGLPDFSALKFTKYNQYESLILPMQKYLEDAGVEFRFNTRVDNVIFDFRNGKKIAKTIECTVKGETKSIDLTENDLVFVTNGSCTEGTIYGDHTHAPVGNAEVRTSGCWSLWKNIAAQDSSFGHPEKFCGDISKSNWESATVTTSDEKIISYIKKICKRDPRTGNVVTGGIVSCKDSSWLLSWTINRQGQFKEQKKDEVCVWVYSLFTDVDGDYIKKPMKECTGEEITAEWLYHLGVPVEEIDELAKNHCNTTPTMMPFITAFFMPRRKGDRPDVIPDGCVNFAFLGQFAETPRDTIFTTEYSVRTAMEAVYGLLGVDRGVPEVWGSVYDVRDLLDSSVKLMDGKSPLEIDLGPFNVIKKVVLKKIKGTVIENVENPTMLQNIQEQDYYVKSGDKYTLKGLSFALILEPRKSDNSRLDSAMSDGAIKSYGKECIEKFYKVIRSADEFEKIKNLPILITVYQAADTTTDPTSGRYILKSYCQKELGEISTLNQRTVLFASEQATKYDKATASAFDTVKTSLKNAATEAAGFVGEARYIDDEIQSMVIKAHLNVKTSTELMYLTSIIADGIESKFSDDFNVKVLVYSQDDVEAIIIKDKGDSVKSYFMN